MMAMDHMGGGMWLGKLLSISLVIALIVALVSLSVYLVRHSGPPRA